jgi:hypothetical protein
MRSGASSVEFITQTGALVFKNLGDAGQHTYLSAFMLIADKINYFRACFRNFAGQNFIFSYG